MKKIFFVVLFAITTTVLLGQSKKVAFKYTKTISSDSLFTEKRGEHSITRVANGALKNGINKLPLSSGNILYIEFRHKKIKKFTIATNDGTIINEFLASDIPTQFRCENGVCTCVGTKDCFEMGNSSICGSSATCVGGFCICQMKKE